jgi:hypothetical protein
MSVTNVLVVAVIDNMGTTSSYKVPTVNVQTASSLACCQMFKSRSTATLEKLMYR